MLIQECVHHLLILHLLLGNLLFKRSIGRPWLRSHLIGMAALSALYVAAPAIPGLTALGITWITNGVLALVVVIDELVWPHDEEDESVELEQIDAA